MTETECEVPSPISFIAAASLQRLQDGYAMATGRGPSLTLKRGDSHCKHSSFGVQIDSESREVSCGKCGARVDPFDALLWVAQSERRMQQEVDTINKEREMQRGFYAALRTQKAKTCRHTKMYDIGGGMRKCLRCETTMKSLSAEIPHDLPL